MTHRFPHARLIHRKASRNWAVAYEWEGKTLVRSFDVIFQMLGMRGDATDEAQCRAALPIFQGELTRAFLGGGTPKRPTQEAVTLGDVADCYRRRLKEGRVSATHAQVQRRRLDSLVASLGGESAPALTLDTPKMDGWLSDRLASGISPTTARNELICLKAAYRQAVADKLLHEVPFSLRAPAPRKRDRMIPPEHQQLLTERCVPTKAAHRFIMVALFTGLRASDILALTWGQVEEGWIRVRTRKTGQVVRIPVHPRLSSYLALAREDAQVRAQEDAEEAPDMKPIPVVGTRYHNCKRATRTLLYGYSDAGHAEPGKEGYSPHEFRHTFLSRLMSAGVHPRLLQSLAGHSSPLITLGTYTHPTDGDLVAAIQALGPVENSPKPDNIRTVPSRT
jgi:integrase